MKKLNEKKPTYFELLKLDGKFVSVDNEGKTRLTENISEAYMLDCKIVEIFKKYLNEKIVDGDKLIETIKGVQTVQINNESGSIIINEKTCNPVNNGIVLRETKKERVLMKGADLKYFYIEWEFAGKGEKVLFRIHPTEYLSNLYHAMDIGKSKWSTRKAGCTNDEYEVIIEFKDKEEKVRENKIREFYRTTDKDKKIKEISLSIGCIEKYDIDWVLLSQYEYNIVIDSLKLLCSKLEEKEDCVIKEKASGFTYKD